MPEEPTIRRGRGWAVLRAVLRALRSTVVIAAVALTLFAIRQGGLRFRELKQVALEHANLWALVFVGVLVWDFLFRRRPTT